jgi:hypothetical protein
LLKRCLHIPQTSIFLLHNYNYEVILAYHFYRNYNNDYVNFTYIYSDLIDINENFTIIGSASRHQCGYMNIIAKNKLYIKIQDYVLSTGRLRGIAYRRIGSNT